MAFGWAYVNCSGSSGTGGASGPSGSIQFMTGSGAGVSSGSVDLTYTAATRVLKLTGTLDVNGVISASHYHIENVTEIDSSGSTFFGNTNDDVHARTGSLTMKNVAGDTNLNVTATGRTDMRQVTVEYTAVDTTPYTASMPLYIIGVKQSGDVKLQIPNAANATAGNILLIKDEVSSRSAGGFDITVNTGGGTIDGATTYVLTGTLPAISLYSDGTNWLVF